MGPGAEADPLAVQPINAVVAGLSARQRPVCDFVVVVAMLGQKTPRKRVHGQLLLVAGQNQLPSGVQLTEERAVLNDKTVARQMVRTPRDDFGERAAPIVLVLTGQA